jgi:nucleoid DNA-binding protein
MEEVEATTKIVLSPSTRPEFPAMAKTCNLEKQAFHKSLTTIFSTIGELLSEGKNVEVDLHELGKIQS